MKKVRSLSDEKINEISALIGASFRDYPYNRKTHLVHIVLSFPFAALLSWISPLI